MTTIESARRTVLSRCAMTNEVRPCIKCANACWICRSVAVSTLEVASSNNRIRGSRSSARRNGDALFLAAGERHATLTHVRRIAVRQVDNKVVRLGGLGRGDNLFLCGSGAAKGDILAQRGGEERALLQTQYRSDRARKPGSRHADRSRRSLTRPFGGVVKTGIRLIIDDLPEPVSPSSAII